MRRGLKSRENSVITFDVKKQFTQFLQSFTNSEQNGRQPKYVQLIKGLIDNGRHVLIIDFQDFITFNVQLANIVFDQYFKYESALNQALTQFARQCEKNSLGVLQETKRDDQKEEKYQVAFNSSINSAEQASVRDLRCEKLGKLFSFRGTVTRTTQVRPQLVVGIFRCKNCGSSSKPIHQQFKYTEPKKCFGKNCDKPIWQLDIQKSEVADFQKIRVQEDPSKIPPGAMPRSIDVVLRNENTEKGQPGDICKFIGYLCVMPDISSMMRPGERTIVNTRNIETRGQMMEMEGVSGIKGIRQLNYRLIFIATNVIVENNQFRQEVEKQDNEQHENNQQQNRNKPRYNQEQLMGSIFSKLTEQEIQLIQEFKSNNNLYEDLANSLFPSIFGQSQIKKAILLQLLGGIHKTTGNKISIRGDINILIVGDPSTAKSQFLKTVNKFVPRSVYTNGKTTSAAGLTATVTKDQTGSVGIEAGALMLADNGICCIDEFDKMDYSDQTAIHQAMQQQTISIAKAGVYATLNARTSILAAANPVYGRYDKSKSLKNNINISAPIMSRFDLFFVICDETNDNADANLSQFIINMHRNKQKAIVTKYDSKSIKLYISIAKKLKPMITYQSAQLLRKFYQQLRLRDKTLDNTSYRITVRQLQSMIRISEGLARLHLDPQIKEEYVKQAFRLITTCIMKLQKSPITLYEEQLYEQEILTERKKMRELQKMSDKQKGDIALQKQLQQKRRERAHKQVSISYEEYHDIQKNVVDLFKKKKQIQEQMLKQKQKQKSEKKSQTMEEDEQQIKIDQESLVNYILGIKFQAGMIDSQEQSHQMKKIINAVIKKLIREERVLMVLEDSPNISERILTLHSNFVI